MPAHQPPLPAQTPAPEQRPLKRSKRRRQLSHALDVRAGTSRMPRQVITDAPAVEQAQRDCQFSSGNEVISCFPTSDTTFVQHEWATFVWNSRRPELTQTNLVNIYLFHGDSLEQILYYPNQTNPTDQAGLIRAQVNDSWWGERGSKWPGTNITYPFYWVITRNDKTLDGSELPQSVFRAVQTTLPDSIVASMASTSAAAASSASAASATRSRNPQATGGDVQSASSGSSFPHWAIAVIVVLGFLAIVATCTLAFLITRRIRRRNASVASNRNSMGSASPMMEHPGHSPQSPLLAAPAAVPQRQPSSVGHHAPSVVSPDGASTISRAGSAGDAGPFSGADAAIMADAFRKALRKPDFAGRPVDEGDSPDHSEERKEQLLSHELAEEGRDIRSVGSSRGVTVETRSDGEDTIQDHPHRQ